MAHALGQLEAKPIARGAKVSANGASTTTLVVEDMVCGGCMRKVETALTALGGVASARANLSARRVTVVHAAGVAVAELEAALARAGFAAAELTESVPTAAG